MALTRKLLKGMGLTEEQQDTIMEARAEEAEVFKGKLAPLEEQVKELAALRKRLEEAEKALSEAEGDGWKDKHDKVKKDFDDYKAAQEAKELRAAKEAAVRSYLESKNIRDKNLTIAMRGLSAEIDGAELEDGKLKDTKALDELIAGDLSGLVSATQVRGAAVSTPPAAQQSAASPTTGEKPPSRAAVLAAKYHENLYGKVKEG